MKKISKIKLSKNDIKKVAISLIFIIFIIAVCEIIALIGKDKITNNISSVNMGLATISDGVIYYNKYEKGIVKYKGNKEYEITNETAYSINVVDDDIYYLTISNDNTIDIKTVKTNGDGLRKIKSIYTSISKIFVKDGYIYYATNQNLDGISRINIETNEETMIITSNIQDFNIINDEIYFTDNISNLYKMSLTGTNLERISEDLKIKQFQVLNKWIYYIDQEEKVLCKVNLKGEKRAVVSDKINDNIYNVTSKKIYYFDSKNKTICSMNLNGKKIKDIVILQTNKTKINVVDNIIYYLDASKDDSQIYQMYRINKNGMSTKKIEY